jgi:hypothetical protein
VTPIEEPPMSVHALKPWTELVKLHADVESGNLAQSVFAIDPGAVAPGDLTTPKVYHDPNALLRPKEQYFVSARDGIGGLCHLPPCVQNVVWLTVEVRILCALF